MHVPRGFGEYSIYIVIVEVVKGSVTASRPIQLLEARGGKLWGIAGELTCG